MSYSFRLSLLQNLLSLKWFKLVAITLVELVLHLDPVESKAMQEAFHLVHAHNDSKCNGPENWEQNEAENKSQRNCSSSSSCHATSTFVNTDVVLDNQVEEDFRELTMSKRKSPESEVRSSV